jgi:hypothetical protein
MTWKYSTDVMNGRYTIHWSPSTYGNPYVNSIQQIDLGDISFQDVTFVYDINSRSAYVCVVVKDKLSLQTYDIPTFMISSEFLYDMGLNCEDKTPKNDKFIEKLILILDKTGFWNSASTKQKMTKKPTKTYTIKNLEYDPNLFYEKKPTQVDDSSKLKNEIKQKDALIAELKEQIQEMKEDIEMLKAVNQEY